MGANILRLLGLIGGYHAMKPDDNQSIPVDHKEMKKAEKKALKAYETSPAHIDRLVNMEEPYDFNRLRNRIK